jgi:hypothetical protein
MSSPKKSSLLKKTPLAMTMLFLSGCAPPSAPSFDATKPVSNPCDGITLPHWTPEMRASLAAEIVAAPSYVMIEQAVSDLFLVEDGVRACKKG